MAKSFRQLVYETRTQARNHYEKAPMDTSAALIRELADLLCGICDWIDCAKIRKHEEPQPDDQQDDVGRILEIAQARVSEFLDKAKASLDFGNYLDAAYQDAMATALLSFSADIRKEFNRD